MVSSDDSADATADQALPGGLVDPLNREMRVKLTAEQLAFLEKIRSTAPGSTRIRSNVLSSSGDPTMLAENPDAVPWRSRRTEWTISARVDPSATASASVIPG